MTSQTVGILSEIRAERDAQDAQWGGPDHDDRHMPWDWDGLLWRFLRRVADEPSVHDDWKARRRRALMQLASVAVANVEAIDRTL